MIGIVFIGAAAVVLAVLWRQKIRELPPRWRTPADVAESIFLVGLIGVVIVFAYRNITAPNAWDFPVFYTAGRNAVEGLSFYDPEALLATFGEVQRDAGVPPDWLGEFGFWYAPPTALVLMPVALFDYTIGLVVQYVIQGAFFAASIYLLHRAYPLRQGPMGLVDMAIVGFAFRPVLSAFILAQVVFGALFFLVLATRAVRGRPWLAGVALGVGAMFKHLLLIPAVLALSIRKWRVTVGAIGAVMAASIIAGLVFGFDSYREFVTFGPGDRSPAVALDPVIESLNGVLRRAFDAVPEGSGAIESILYPPYLAIGAALTLATVVVAWRARRDTSLITLTFAMMSVLSLIVYPNTLYNTLPLVIPALVVLIWNTHRLPLPPPITVAFVAVQYGIVATRLIPGILALVLTWIFLAAVVTAATSRGRATGEAAVAPT